MAHGAEGDLKKRCRSLAASNYRFYSFFTCFLLEEQAKAYREDEEEEELKSTTRV